jgi:hypothetical protein
MNTNHLKKFAQEARRKLIAQVEAKLDYILNADTVELREKSKQVQQLRQELNRNSKEQLIEKVSYTWFNRFMALRFMDANDYQPLGIRVITPIEGYYTPELLDEAKRGNIPEELRVNRQMVMDLVDGKIHSSNPQNEAYKHLLIAACNHLSSVFPFLFEHINDYTELLLPDDLTSDFSIIADVRNGMLAEDCKEVEIIGWLYQFYISERKDELINAKKKYKADEIAPVTQLFTPKWIVEYMVDNTLGQLWNEYNPNTNITPNLHFYIEPHSKELIPTRKPKSVEEIKFFDPCVGSAHILSYAFDLFYKMYEESGYNPSEIPELIISKNLFGIDIDERAAQLAGFVLMMKGRRHNRRFLRKAVEPNITAFQNIDSHPKFKNANLLGSLIKIEHNELDEIQIEDNSIFATEQTHLLKQATLLADKYDVVVTNPPYLNSSYMEDTLKQYIEKEYKDTKADLFACFVIQAMNLANKDGMIGFISPYVWLFISSYEKLREKVINYSTLSSLIQLEYNAFEPACVPIATFTLRNSINNDYQGSYIKLSDFRGHQNQAPKTIEAIRNPNCGWFFTANQKDFQKIPASPIGYWLSKKMINIFSSSNNIEEIAAPKQGLITGNNERFVRLWYECNSENGFRKWFPFNKGGEIRKWFGNQIHTVNWGNNGESLQNFKDTNGKLRSRTQNIQYYFKESISWTKIGSSEFTARYYNDKFIFSDAGLASFPPKKYLNYLLGLMNSKMTGQIISSLNPTLNRNIGDINKIPVIINESKESISNLVENCRNISSLEWNSRETSWDFHQNELIRIKGEDLEISVDLFKQYWENKFYQLHQNEEELNRQFNEIYGLQDELTPNVQLKDITILKEETSILNDKLNFLTDEVLSQFLSYSVGCVFGRYSLDKKGLMLAIQGETLQDYFTKIEKQKHDCSFLPDEDNIIPILDDDWFEDDIVGRFYEFLKVTFGEKNFQKNLSFVEDQIGMDIRKYFIKDFYSNHIKRYKKRPIYWMFSSPKGSFNVIIYMHRYTPDTISNILNNYLREFSEKLRTRKEHLQQVMVSGSASQKTSAIKENDKIDKMLVELREYERDTLFPLATERISIDLDDGVLVNYNKFGKAIKEVKGLNDTVTKKKVKQFDWIDTTQIR